MIDLQEYGFSPEYERMYAAPAPCALARVTAVHRERYELVCAEGFCVARLKSGVYYAANALPFPTTGDFVRIQYNPNGESLIVETLPRRSFFSRRDPSAIGREASEQAVAANFDEVCLLSSLNQDFNPRRMERYLTIAWQSGASPILLLTKADLCSDAEEKRRLAEALAPGVPVFVLSAHSGEGLAALRTRWKRGQTLVFLGSSGVGKSSLVNALAGMELMGVKEISDNKDRGRHTTTHRQLLRLPQGALEGLLIIDTPGMRELGVYDVSQGLGEAFEDVEAVLADCHCKFSDCSHHHEPGCAVRAALEEGRLDEKRWQNYQKLKKEARYAESPQDYMRAKFDFHKQIARNAREIKKGRR